MKRVLKVKQRQPSSVISPVAGIFVESTAIGEDDEGYFSIAKHGQFIGLFEEAIATLAESHLTVGRVLNPLDLDLSTAHFWFFLISTVWASLLANSETSPEEETVPISKTESSETTGSKLKGVVTEEAFLLTDLKREGCGGLIFEAKEEDFLFISVFYI